MRCIHFFIVSSPNVGLRYFYGPCFTDEDIVAWRQLAKCLSDLGSKWGRRDLNTGLRDHRACAPKARCWKERTGGTQRMASLSWGWESDLRTLLMS